MPEPVQLGRFATGLKAGGIRASDGQSTGAVTSAQAAADPARGMRASSESSVAAATLHPDPPASRTPGETHISVMTFQRKPRPPAFDDPLDRRVARVAPGHHHAPVVPEVRVGG